MAKSIKRKPTAKKSAKKKAKPVKKTARAKKTAHAEGMHDAREVVHERRYETRILVSNMTFAAVSFQADQYGKAGYVFSTDLSGLLVDTSAGGCSLIFMQVNPLSVKLKRETQCVIQIAPEPPRLATVRWVKDLDVRLKNAGFAFN